MVLLPFTESNLILTGYTGPYQPAIGRRVAERLQRPFINIDSRIEELAELPLEEVRIRYGEARLKMLETEAVDEMVLRRGMVVRISGETLLHGEHFTRLETTGPVICLTTMLDVVLQQLHLAMGSRYHDPAERAIAVGHIKREWGVRKLDDIHELDVTYLHEDEIVNRVVASWEMLAT